ncbi:FERM domain-containing protein 3 [Echinococcus granulosus]|uniref:FERM domain containing protein 3 n=1 Tax=Echinococcus granulosus TaxID=6210 RepID=A0A068WGX6_ECHGR|nr:FERM domain-containing protein 3 [Echinococcus granulosus]CDS16848.1 FERM domain containing protein 3 [Echinococcus granulosus]
MTSTSTLKSTTRSSRRSTDDGLQVTVSLLENDCFITIWVPEQASGRWLLEEVCKKQAVLPEIEYFGLRYISCELLSSPSKHWMNPVKLVRPQLKHTNPLMVSFRIKHYPPDPFSDFKLDKSKYLLFHQLHRDFLSGRLIAPHEDLIRLAAFFIQVTLGDASEMAASMLSLQSPSASTRTDSSTYLSNYRALHNTSSKKNELEILEEHRKLEGVLPSEAAAEAIRIALRQPSYGLEPFKVQLTKRKDSRPVHIGLTHEGVAEFLGSKRAHLFKWAEIDQFFYSGKNFIIRHQKAASKRQKSAHEITEYKCESRAIASELWSWALERKLFFTLEKSSIVKPITTKYKFFSRRHTFTFAGRCHSELMNPKPSSATLSNCHSGLQKTKTWCVPLGASTPGLDHLHHHHRQKHISKSSTFSSMASRLGPTKSFNEFNINDATSTSSVAGSTLTEEEQSCGEFSNGPEASERGSTSTADPPAFIKLAPYFESIPNRKYTSLSRLRQMRCVKLASDPTTRSQRSMEDLRLNGILGQPISEAQEPTSELVKRTADYSTSDSFYKDRKMCCKEVDEKTQSSDGSSCRTISPLWRYVLITGGITLIVIVLGTSLAFDFGMQGPLLLKVRSSSLFIKWENYCYRPLQSLLLRALQ